MTRKTALVLLTCWSLSSVPAIAQTDQATNSLRRVTAVEATVALDRTGQSVGATDNTRGDVDGNGMTEPADITFLIRFLYEGGPAPEAMQAADIDGNGTIGLLDITSLIGHLYSGEPVPDAYRTWVRIINLQPDDATINGIAAVDDTSKARVVLWAKTDRWYVQPSVADPYTTVQSDSGWSSPTYPWTRMLALLVDSNYVPGSIREYHPATDRGVITWDEYPEKSIRHFDWSDHLWRVKTGNLVGPGPNFFSDDEANVWIDEQDRLHLKYDYRDNKWYCSEVVLDRSLGYGIYTFKLDSRVDNLDYNTIFAGFIYETINQEFDIEFSRRLVTGDNDAQYVAQPWHTSGNIETFKMPAGSQTSHSFEWRSDRIVCKSWNGHADTPSPATLIYSWTYTGEDIPPPGGERMIFNLYLHSGDPPVDGLEDEVIVKSFDYTKLERVSSEDSEW